MNLVKAPNFWCQVGIEFDGIMEKYLMEKNQEKKRGPKDRSYVNQSEKHEVKYEPKRKTPAKKFGSGK
jgi:hypothetical protein